MGVFSSQYIHRSHKAQKAIVPESIPFWGIPLCKGVYQVQSEPCQRLSCISIMPSHLFSSRIFQTYLPKQPASILTNPLGPSCHTTPSKPSLIAFQPPLLHEQSALMTPCLLLSSRSASRWRPILCIRLRQLRPHHREVLNRSKG